MPYTVRSQTARQSESSITAKLLADLIPALVRSGPNMDLHAPDPGLLHVPVDTVRHGHLVHRKRNSRLSRAPAPAASNSPGYSKAHPASPSSTSASTPPVAEVHNVVGDVSGMTALIVDDIVDTGGTLTKVAMALKEAGARDVLASSSHAVLSGEALRRIGDSPLSQLIVTDSIPMSDEKLAHPKLKVLSVGELLGKAIRNIHEEASVTSLFV